MTEALRARIQGLYDDLRTIATHTPGATVGNPTITILRELLTSVKDAGGDARLCDAMLTSLALSSRATIAATDALVIAGQLLKLSQ